MEFAGDIKYFPLTALGAAQFIMQVMDFAYRRLGVGFTDPFSFTGSPEVAGTADPNQGQGSDLDPVTASASDTG